MLLEAYEKRDAKILVEAVKKQHVGFLDIEVD